MSPHKVREESVGSPNLVQVETVSAVRGETQREPFPAHKQLYGVRTPRAVSTVKERSKNQRSKGFGRRAKRGSWWMTNMLRHDSRSVVGQGHGMVGSLS